MRAGASSAKGSLSRSVVRIDASNGDDSVHLAVVMPAGSRHHAPRQAKPRQLCGDQLTVFEKLPLVSHEADIFKAISTIGVPGYEARLRPIVYEGGINQPARDP